MYHIYLVTELDTGKRYVGASTKAHNSNYYGSGKLIKEALSNYRSISEKRKHFKKEILEECVSKEELNEREDFWIKKLNTLYPSGYNIRRRGSLSHLDQRPKGKYEKLLVVDRRFGSWVIAGVICRDAKSRVKVYCTCDCGHTQFVYANQLINGKTTQCKKCSSGESDTKKALANKAYRRILGAVQTSSISPSELLITYAAQNEMCALTGEVIPSREATAVRWDNSKGFITGNTLITSKTISGHMGDMDGKTFVDLCQQVISHKPTKRARSVKEFFDKREKE